MLYNYDFYVPFSAENLEHLLCKIQESWPNLLINYPLDDEDVNVPYFQSIDNIKNKNFFSKSPLELIFIFENEEDYELDEGDWSTDDDEMVSVCALSIVMTKDRILLKVPRAKDCKQNAILLNLIPQLKELQPELSEQSV